MSSERLLVEVEYELVSSGAVKTKTIQIDAKELSAKAIIKELTGEEIDGIYEGATSWFAMYDANVTSAIGFTEPLRHSVDASVLLRSVCTKGQGSNEIEMGYQAFKNCSHLISVDLPEGLTAISSYAFENCTALKEVRMPSSTIYIRKGAFKDCKSLVYVTIPDAVRSIGSEAFKGSKVSEAILPSGLRILDDDAFKFCTLYIDSLSTEDPLRPVIGGKTLEGVPLSEQGLQAMASCKSFLDRSVEIVRDYVEEQSERAARETPPAKPNDEGGIGLGEYLRLAYEAEANVLQLTEACILAHSDWRRSVIADKHREEYDSYVFERAEEERRRLIEREKKEWEDELSAIKLGSLLNADDFARIGERPSPDSVGIEPSRPAEPVYDKPGLFNRKRVEAKNDELRRQYREQLDAYKVRLEDWQRRKAAYEGELEGWMGRREEAIRAQVEAYGEFESSLAAPEEDPMAARVKRLRDTAEQVYKALTEELAEAIRIRARVYSTNTIYPKYRSLEAVSTMHEYLETGRCTSLAGPDGAYNLYESEVRANAVIDRLDVVNSKLDVISQKLEDIKASQYALYLAVSNIGAQLDAISDTLLDILGSTEAISSQVSDLVSNSAAITHWTRRNAELTDSLGFLISVTS